MKMLEKKLVELGDDEIRQLIEELEKVTGVRRDLHSEFTVFQFFQQCLQPHGGISKPIRITKDCISEVDDLNQFILQKKVGKLGDLLYGLLKEIADNRNESLENHSGKAVFVFLNRMLIPSKGRKLKRFFWPS